MKSEEVKIGKRRMTLADFWWIRGESLSPAGSVGVGSDVPPARHSLPTRSIPLRQKRKTRFRAFLLFLVDPRGIEPLSENLAAGLSSWTVCCLEFPLNGGNRQPPLSGSPLMHDWYKCEIPVHVHHYLTLSTGSWSSPVNGRHNSRGTAVRQPVLRCYR